MSQTSAYFGLIIAHDANQETMSFTLMEIAKYHTLLPYRLLIVTANDDEKTKWEIAINKASANPECFFPATPESFTKAKNEFKVNEDDITPILPFRRVHVISNSNFLNVNGESSDTSGANTCTDSCAKLKNINRETWDQLILEVYKQWIQAWKGDPPGADKRWKLLIGFQRDAKQIEQRWKDQLNVSQNVGDLMDVFVGAKPKGDATGQLLRSVIHAESVHSPISEKYLPPASKACLGV